MELSRIRERNSGSKRRRGPCGTACLVVLLGVSIFAGAVDAQVLYGSLTGTITDSSGAAVPAAHIEALNKATGLTRVAVTDEHGGYLFGDLLPGLYNVTISATSFGKVVQEDLQVEANREKRVDGQLQPAGLKQTVTVDASAAPLQTDRADVNSEIRASQIANLPLTGQRNFQSLYKLMPGVSPPVQLNSEAGNPQDALGYNVNGVSNLNNATLIDGTSDVYFWLGHVVAYVPPAEAVEAVNVVTNSFNAEQGLAGGSVVNVSIKSGTNQFHGSAWEYNTISALKARNYFYHGANNPKYIMNQFGVTLGGPIVKNKLFFFVDWERTMRRQNISGLETVAPDALKQGNFVGTSTTIYDPSTGNSDGTGRVPFANNQIPAARLAAAAVKLVALLPAPNLTGSIANDYFASASYAYTRDNADIKVNFIPGEKSSVFARYSVSPTNIFDPQALGAAGGPAIDGGQPGNAPSLIQSAGIGGTYDFTPNLFLDANVGFTRQHIGAENTDIGKNYGSDVLGIPGTNGPDRLDGGYPEFQFSTGFTNLGNPNSSNPFLFRDNQFLTAANLSWTKGTHSLRFGAQYQHFAVNHFQPQTDYGPRGGFTFTGGLSSLKGGASPNLYNDWADFLLGLANSMGQDYAAANPSSVREDFYGLYAQDQWQATRKLTVTYGLRYEYYPMAHRDHYGADIFDPSTGKVSLGGLGGVPYNAGIDVGIGQLAPRAGVAYRLNAKTVIRAGFGISIEPNNYREMASAYPAVISAQYNGVNSYAAAGSLATGLPSVTFPNLSQGTLTLPATVSTYTYPKEADRGYIESYNFTVQREILTGLTAQAAYVGTRAIRQAAEVNINPAAPGGGTNGRALYAALGITANITEVEPFNTATYNSLQTQLTKRLSRGLSFGATYTFSRAIDYAQNEDSGLTFNYVPAWGRNKALADFDRTHNFQLFSSYDLPFGKGHNLLSHGLSAGLAGGWQVNGVLSATSGTPFTVTASGTALNAPGNTQTANQTLTNVAILGGHGSNAPYFNSAAFAPVNTPGVFGNSGRDILRGPGLFNIDFSLFRTFRLTERFSLQFRAEAFNASNTPQFGNPSANVSSATFNSGGVIQSLNGYSLVTSASNERQLRFALKLSF